MAVDVIGGTYAQSGCVEAKVRKLRVAVGVVSHVESEVEVDMARGYPAQIQVEPDICRDARTYQFVVGIVNLVVRFPSEGKSEIPLVVERQSIAQTGYACALQQKYRHRIAQLRIELVPSDANALVSVAVDACLLAALGSREGILKVIAHIVVHGAHFGILATQKVVGMQNGARTIVEH